MTSRIMAERCAALMGGNGLSVEQSINLMAIELYEFKNQVSLMAKDGLVYLRGKHVADWHCMGVGADRIAEDIGVVYAERLVKLLEWREQLMAPKPV